MTPKLSLARDYRPEFTDAVHAACLHLATILGDFLDDIVIVGGLVPTLLIDQSALPDGAQPHVGTTDLDVGLALGVLDDVRYSAIAERLRQNSFAPDPDEDGRHKYRWRHVRPGRERVSIDFLIPPAGPDRKPGKLHMLEPGFVAIIAPALDLAFLDAETIALSGHTLDGERATRKVRICGPAAFVAMKAHAFRNRGEPKDAYDLFYVLRNFGSGIEAVARRWAVLAEHDAARAALEFLREDFTEADQIGPSRIGRFLATPSASLRTDVATFVRELLRLVKAA